MLELTEKNIKTVIMTVFHKFKKLESKDIKTQIELVEMKNKVHDNNSL